MRVQDMRDCAWCNAKKPVGHDCPAGAVGCTAGRDDGTTCGECEACTRAQTQSLAARDAEFRLDPYGSPSDIDTPDPPSLPTYRGRQRPTPTQIRREEST